MLYLNCASNACKCRIARALLATMLCAALYGAACWKAWAGAGTERSGWSVPALAGVVIEVSPSGDGVRFASNNGRGGEGDAFVSRKQVSDFLLEATVEADPRNGAACCSGLMARADEGGASLFFSIGVSKDGMLIFEWRDKLNGEIGRLSQQMQSPTQKPIIRLERKGSLVLASQKLDAGLWKTLFKQRIPDLPNSLIIGPVVTSAANVKEVKFSGIRLAGDGLLTIFEKVPPESELWKAMLKKVYYEQLWLNDESQLKPASKDNPRGYTTTSPWASSYKKPEPLIAGLDIQGPDGLIYPNFTRAGVVGGIPEGQPVIATISSDSGDFAGDIDKAIAEMGDKKKGVIVLGKGEFVLKRPLRIARDGVVIRGSGSGAEGTVIKFAYGLKNKEIRWLMPETLREGGNVIGSYDRFEVHADISPKGNVAPSGVVLTVDGQEVATIKKEAQVEGTFRLGLFGRSLFARGIKPGLHTLKAAVQWPDGSSSENSRQIYLDPTAAAKFGPYSIESEAAFFFSGEGPVMSVPLSTTLKRGDSSISGLTGLALKEGDFIRVLSSERAADENNRWRRKVRLAGNNTLFREIIFQVKSVDESKVELDQPARIEIEGAPWVQVNKVGLIQDCGVENLCIETTEPIWMTSVLFRYAANCWVRNVRFEKPGRHGFWTMNVKWMEARDIEINEGWYRIGGGTAYVGWETAFDCLMDGVKATGLRHAPDMQWSTSGCVIRNGVFEGSEAQFHAGWPNENLIENCTIHSKRGESGSYGFGVFAQAPECGGHGPQGPRNVIYNNDFVSDKSGVWFGGSNEGYLILYNRFRVLNDPAVLLKAGSFDHTFLGNVFIVQHPVPAAVVIMTPDCTGVSFIKNDFYGVSNQSSSGDAIVFLGAIPPEKNEGNRYFPYQDAPRPQPKVPSIYEWQMKNK